MSNLITKRFVIRKSLIGKNVIITFTNKKNEEMSYNHDEVYNTHKEKFDSMNCFNKYKSYTNSNTIPAFCRDLNLSKQSMNFLDKLDNTMYYTVLVLFTTLIVYNTTRVIL